MRPEWEKYKNNKLCVCALSYVLSVYLMSLVCVCVYTHTKRLHAPLHNPLDATPPLHYLLYPLVYTIPNLPPLPPPPPPSQYPSEKTHILDSCNV